MTVHTSPLISIGIPTYNRAGSYLKGAIECVLKQTYQNLELIISDNCSTDNTEELIRTFSDKRIKYIRQNKNIGPQNNFNYCLEQATGDYFLLLHSDDLIDIDFLECCMKNSNYLTDFGIIRTGVRMIDTHGNTINETLNRVEGVPIDEFFRGWFNYKTSWYFCNTLFHTKRLKEIGGFQSERQLTQDGRAITKLAAKYDRVDAIDVKASFRKHDDEITHSTKIQYWCEEFSDLLDLMCQVSLENKPLVRSDGEWFFAKICYNFADSQKSPLQRLSSYFLIFRKFGRRNLMVILQRFIRKSSTYAKLRILKRTIFPGTHKDAPSLEKSKIRER